MAAKLWACPDVAVWASLHMRLGEALQSKQNSKSKPSKLLELQKWFAHELPGAVTGRKEPYLTKPELVKLVEWKLARDTFRPKLVQYAQSQDESVVQATTKAALKLLPSGADTSPTQLRDAVGKAMTELVKLKGVGPGTASALLSAVCPVPYMSPPAMAVAACKSGDYTQAAYLKMLQAFQDKCEELKAAATTAGVELEDWLTPKGLEECLFVADIVQDVDQVFNDSGDGAAGGDGSKDGSRQQGKQKAQGKAAGRPAKRSKT